MGMFDYKQYGSKGSAELLLTSQKLAIFSNAASFMLLPGASIINVAGKITSPFNWYPNKFNIAPPVGWRELTPAELGLPENSKDWRGYYTFNSTVTGNRLVPGMGPQAKIFGEFKEGKVTRVSVSWAGTNDPLDVMDYFSLNEGKKVAKTMNPLLESLKAYSEKNGLTGEDVIVTGYSLGGGLTNVMAKYREQLADGFFNDSVYIGHASPLIYNNGEVILNVGFENDAVYRILGDAPSFPEAMAEWKPLLVNPDKNFSSTVNNMIIFNGTYASPLWWDKIATSILNIPQGWAAHKSGVITDGFERLINSSFYDLTQKDSVVVIDSLNAFSRLFSWVRDKSKSGKPAFILGNEYNNKLLGGDHGDYIDAKGGNDKIQPGKGADVIDGGTGIDTVILDGARYDWDAYRLSDGSIFMHSQRSDGLKELVNVERLAFNGEFRSKLSPYSFEENQIVDNRYLLKWRNSNMSYKDKVEGSEQDDYLTGAVVFGRDGNDLIESTHTQTDVRGLLHGGAGDDTLISKAGYNELYGGEGNDIIYASGLRNNVYGGVGNDIFAFNAQSKGYIEIRDFNKYANEQDQLLFTQELFETKESVLKSATQQNNNVYIYKENLVVSVMNSSLDEVSNNIAIV